MATTPTINPVNSPSTSAGGHYLIPHQHDFASITGLRFGANGRVEPVYDAANVYANGQVIALYNASSTEGAFAAPAVPKVTIIAAVQNVEGDEGNVAGKQEADKFLEEGRITKKEYDTITTTPTPKGEGTKPSPPIVGQTSAAVSGDLSFATVLTPKGTTLGTMIKAVTFPRTIQQLADHNSTVSGPQNVVNNLAALALNCYEPIKAKYPNAFMTNSFRDGKIKNGVKVPDPGQHGSGQACDIQFRGVSAHDYYDIAVWISKNISYDQLLLEYLPSKTVWIHISYAIPGLPYGGKKVAAGNRLATLNGAAGGKFTPNLHADIIQAALPNKVVAA